jgi:hypothetical protein
MKVIVVGIGEVVVMAGAGCRFDGHDAMGFKIAAGVITPSNRNGNGRSFRRHRRSPCSREFIRIAGGP